MVDLPSRMLQSPKVGLGVTTAALIALATGGTSLLVSHGARQLQQPAPVVAAPQPSGVPRAPVVVDRAPGSIALPPAYLVATPPRAQPVITAPDVPAPAVESPVPPAPSAVPVTPPVAVPPPVVQPPAPTPPVPAPALSPGHRHHVHPEHPDDNGKHLGQLKH